MCATTRLIRSISRCVERSTSSQRHRPAEGRPVPCLLPASFYPFMCLDVMRHLLIDHIWALCTMCVAPLLSPLKLATSPHSRTSRFLQRDACIKIVHARTRSASGDERPNTSTTTSQTNRWCEQLSMVAIVVDLVETAVAESSTSWRLSSAISTATCFSRRCTTSRERLVLARLGTSSVRR